MMEGVYSKSILGNGVRVITEKIANVCSVSVGIWVAAGSRDEAPEESGISHFIEHMVFKGTKQRSSLDIAKIFDQMGGISNAFTSKEITCFHTKVLKAHLDKALDVLSDIFLHSTFNPLELEKERQVVLQEISMVKDSPDDLNHDLFYEIYWLNHSLITHGRPVFYKEVVRNIEAVTQDAISSLADACLKGRLSMACLGPISDSELISV